VNELSNELVKKMAKIKLLEEKLNNQNNFIENIKKSRNVVNTDKSFNNEELRSEILSKNKKIRELENENGLLKTKTEFHIFNS
jgi:hypothetical protein